MNKVCKWHNAWGLVRPAAIVWTDEDGLHHLCTQCSVAYILWINGERNSSALWLPPKDLRK